MKNRMITKINTGYILVGVVPWKEYAYDFLFQCSALPYGHMTYGEPILYDERAMRGNTSHCSSLIALPPSCSCYVLVMFHWIFGCISVLSNQFRWLAQQQANKNTIQPNKVKLCLFVFLVCAALIFSTLRNELYPAYSFSQEFSIFVQKHDGIIKGILGLLY